MLASYIDSSGSRETSCSPCCAFLPLGELELARSIHIGIQSTADLFQSIQPAKGSMALCSSSAATGLRQPGRLGSGPTPLRRLALSPRHSPASRPVVSASSYRVPPAQNPLKVPQRPVVLSVEGGPGAGSGQLVFDCQALGPAAAPRGPLGSRLHAVARSAPAVQLPQDSALPAGLFRSLSPLSACSPPAACPQAAAARSGPGGSSGGPAPRPRPLAAWRQPRERGGSGLVPCRLRAEHELRRRGPHRPGAAAAQLRRPGCGRDVCCAI